MRTPQSSNSSATSSTRRIATIVGPAVAVLVSWSLSLPGDTDAAGLTLANVALVMAVVTVGLAMVDWLAGAATSVVAALALNYFHTQPYRTLRIADGRDIWSVMLLGVLGLAVSAATAYRVRRRVTALRRVDTGRSAASLADLLTRDRPVPEVWSASISASANDLAMVTTRLERFGPATLPQIGREFHGGDARRLTLPAGGAALRLHSRHPEGRWLVLVPRAGMAPLALDRRAVLAFAETLEIALDPATSADVAGSAAVEQGASS